MKMLAGSVSLKYLGVKMKAEYKAKYATLNVDQTLEIVVWNDMVLNGASHLLKDVTILVDGGRIDISGTKIHKHDIYHVPYIEEAKELNLQYEDKDLISFRDCFKKKIFLKNGHYLDGHQTFFNMVSTLKWSIQSSSGESVSLD